MFSPQQDTDGLQELSLAEVLQRDDLCVQEVLSIAGIQSKIRQELRVFLGHCARNESFADRLITLGLKCPMHQSASPQMQTLTFIAADILTSDQDALADFLLPKSPSSDQGEIAEEIETEEAWSEGSRSESERYKWLNRVLDYLQGEQLDENCVNYIIKSIQVLVRKRLGTLLEYLRACPDVLSRLAHLAHFPSIAQLLTKLITDEDDHMPPAAHEARQMVIPLLLQKLHNDLALPTALEVVDCLESILQASRYSDPEEARSQLQTLSDIIVSAEETSFHLSVLLSTPSPSAANAAAYLAMVVNRMNQDESQDGVQKPFRPTLVYQVEPLFAAFAKLASMAVGLEGDRLLTVRWLQLLVAMGRHSRFAQFYSCIPRDERFQAIRKLVWSVARGNYSGVKLQLASSLVQLAILQEERISESHPDPDYKLSPNTLYNVLSDHQLHLRQLVQSLGHEGPRQRNRNEQGIFLRKLLVVLDNFFKNSEIHRHFPEVQTVATLFPTFTPEACRQYLQGAAIRNHPAGLRARPPMEFGFFRRNQTYLDSQLQLEKIEAETLTQQKQEVQHEEKKPKEEIVFKLTQKIRTLKDRVKEKQVAKTNSIQNSANQVEKQINIAPVPKQSNVQLQQKVLSPSKDRSPMPCLLFFVRHLAIY